MVFRPTPPPSPYRSADCVLVLTHGTKWHFWGDQVPKLPLEEATGAQLILCQRLCPFPSWELSLDNMVLSLLSKPTMLERMQELTSLDMAGLDGAGDDLGFIDSLLKDNSNPAFPEDLNTNAPCSLPTPNQDKSYKTGIYSTKGLHLLQKYQRRSFQRDIN